MGVTDKMLDWILGKKCFYRENREEIECIENRKTVEGGEHSAQDIKGTEGERKERGEWGRERRRARESEKNQGGGRGAREKERNRKRKGRETVRERQKRRGKGGR